MSTQQNAITLNVLNNSNQKPVVYIGEAATLDISLINDTGGTITLVSGKDNPATLLILLPSFYTDADYTKMDIKLEDWTLQKYKPNDLSLTLVYTAAADGSWTTATPLSFKITGAQSDASATNAQSQINLSGLKGNNIPLQVVSSSNLSLEKKPSGKNPNLPIELSLNSPKVFVSNKTHPLENNLTLNFKNTGTSPIYTGTKDRPQTANVIVKFTYGNVAGALAPDNDKASPQLGSAWNIEGKVAISGGNDWGVTNPNNAGQLKSPQWILKPNNTNKGIIGVGVNSNITFNFSKIISFLVPGHTQMTVQFSDFHFDETTEYNDRTFTLDIIKEEPTPGILKFTPIGSSILSYEPGRPSSNAMANMAWQVINVNYVDLTWVGYCGKTITLDSRKTSTDNPCDPGSPFGQIKTEESQYALDLKNYFPKDVLLTLNAYDNNDKKIDTEQITFQFEQIITLNDFAINILAGLGDNNEVSVAASPYQLITKDVLILEDGTIKNPTKSSQSNNIITSQYKLINLIPDTTLNASTTFNSWQAEFNNSPQHSFEFQKVGKIETAFPVSTFNASAVALYTSIGLLNNKGSNLKIDFNDDHSTLNLSYVDIETSNTYRTVNNIKYTIAENGFGISFDDADFVMASNGNGYYKGLSFVLEISLQLEKNQVTYNLNGKASAKNSEAHIEIDVKFTTIKAMSADDLDEEQVAAC